MMITVVLSAQDPHFSQFSSSPLTLNPAFTGKFFGAYRVSGNYRNQWPTLNNAFTTTTASVDFQVLKNRIISSDTWGVGVMGYADNSANGAIKFNYASFSTAYHKGLDEDGLHQIGVGFQVTYANTIVNTSLLTFEDQLTTAGFTGITSEVFSSNTLNSNYIDLNAGLLYNGSTNDQNNFYFGLSMYHINRPKQQFVGAEYFLTPRTNFHAGGYFAIGQTTTMHLSALQMFQGGFSETMVGGAIQLNTNPNEIKSTSLYIGTWMRFNDAIIPYLGLEFGDYRLGASYDYNTSLIRTATQNRGGIEISLVYIRRPSNERPVNCPKF
jgi:type IX secretion system PorP/SprF family membrane protein